MTDKKETYDTIFGCGALILIGGTIATFFMYGMKSGGVAILISMILIATGVIVSEKLEGKTAKKETYDTISGSAFLINITEIIAGFLIYGWKAGVAIFVISFIITIIALIRAAVNDEKESSFQAAVIMLSNVLVSGILLLLFNEDIRKWLWHGICNWFSWLSQHFT